VLLVAGRPKKASGDLGPLEAAVMKAVWEAAAPVSVRQVLDKLNARRPKPLAYTTVMTVMNRLVEKAVLVRRGERRSYVYEATAGDAAAVAVRGLMRAHGQAAVAPFVEQARADPAVLRRLRSLVGEEP
jgi:predicted transcriptional regulator